jgi:hypothetical protein
MRQTWSNTKGKDKGNKEREKKKQQKELLLLLLCTKWESLEASRGAKLCFSEVSTTTRLFTPSYHSLMCSNGTNNSLKKRVS